MSFKRKGLDFVSLWDKDRTVSSVEFKFSSNFNYRFVETAFPNESRTAITVSASIDDCSSIDDFKRSLVDCSKQVLDGWKVAVCLNEQHSLEEWEAIHVQFLDAVFKRISSDDFAPTRIVFVDKQYGLSLEIDCRIYFERIVQFI